MGYRDRYDNLWKWTDKDERRIMGKAPKPAWKPSVKGQKKRARRKTRRKKA